MTVVMGNDSSRSLLGTGTLSQAMTVGDDYWERCYRQCQNVITVGNVVAGNGSRSSLLRTLLQAMAAVDPYWQHSYRQCQLLITTGNIVTGNNCS